MEDIFALKDVISDYDRFCSTAQQLEFPERYVQNNIIQTYVRTVFASKR